MSYKLYNGDCLKYLPQVEDKSVDLILCDLPYGTTKNSWDVKIPLDELWIQYKRVLKPYGVVALFAQFPFDHTVISSNTEMFRYEWIWVKPNGTNFLQCNTAPLKVHEKILIFTPHSVNGNSKEGVYNPQMREGRPYVATSGSKSANYCDYHKVTTVSKGERYPIDVLYFNHDKTKYHPTQKPVALCEYMIKTYTNAGMTVLDNCMGSGTTGVASVTLDRNFIGMELNKEYYDIAVERIEGVQGGIDLLDLNEYV